MSCVSMCVKVWWLMCKTRATKEQPDGKDTQNLTTQLDFDASRALLLGKPYPGSSRPPQYSQTDSETPRNPADAAGGPLSGLERHRLKTIILPVSVRTYHRLAAAGIVESPGCKMCADCTREDHEHLFWQCPGPSGVYKHTRDRWLPLAHQVQAKMVQCVNFFEIRCLRHHGLLPADPRFAQVRDKIPQVDEGDPDSPEVDLDGLSDRWVQSRYEICDDGRSHRTPGKPRPGKVWIWSFLLWHGRPSKFVRPAGHLLSAAVLGRA